MKTILLIFLFGPYTCRHSQQAEPRQPVETNVENNAGPQLDFEKDIQPILESHCKPCHFTGGKMYERMPFDKPQTILEHEDGILRRIKDESEATKIREFITQNTKGKD